MSTPLVAYLLLYRAPESGAFAVPEAFFCKAEDLDHAEGQLESFLPGADCLWSGLVAPREDNRTAFRRVLADYLGSETPDNGPSAHDTNDAAAAPEIVAAARKILAAEYLLSGWGGSAEMILRGEGSTHERLAIHAIAVALVRQHGQPGPGGTDAMVSAFEEHHQADHKDPAVAPEWGWWQAAWQAALAAQPPRSVQPPHDSRIHPDWQACQTLDELADGIAANANQTRSDAFRADVMGCLLRAQQLSSHIALQYGQGDVGDVVLAARNAELAIRNCANAGQIGEGYIQYADDLRDAVQRLAQQSTAPGERRYSQEDMERFGKYVADAREARIAQQPAALDDETIERVLTTRVPGGSQVWWSLDGGGMQIGASHRAIARRVIEAFLAQQPVAVFRNDGNSKADFIAHEANACTACGGSGHKDDQQLAAATPASVDDVNKRAWDLLQAEYEKPYFAGNYEDAAVDAIAAALALAQQPAVVTPPTVDDGPAPVVVPGWAWVSLESFVTIAEAFRRAADPHLAAINEGGDAGEDESSEVFDGALNHVKRAIAVAVQQPTAAVETLPDFLDRIARELVERDTVAGTFAPGVACSLRGRASILRRAIVAQQQQVSTS